MTEWGEARGDGSCSVPKQRECRLVRSNDCGNVGAKRASPKNFPGTEEKRGAKSPHRWIAGYYVSMARVPPLDATPEEVREALAPIRHPFSVAVHACNNAFAVGAIIRVAHNFLAREVLIVGEEPFYEKASMGMQKYETIVKLPNDDALFAHAAGRPVFAIEKDQARRSLYDVRAFPKDVVFVFGSERAGLSRELCARADDALGIPIYGVNNSLPVAVAAGIVMAEWARSRYVSGA